MKICAVFWLGMTLAFARTHAEELDLLATCHLGVDMKREISVLAYDRIGDSYRPRLRLSRDGDTVPLFADMDDEESRGRLSIIRCVGDKEKVLLMAGEFHGSGYPRGLAIRYQHGQLQRLEFAEHAFPTRVYLSQSAMLLYIPVSHSEPGHAWSVYRYDVENGQRQEVPTARRLPPPGSFSVIKVP